MKRNVVKNVSKLLSILFLCVGIGKEISKVKIYETQISSNGRRIVFRGCTDKEKDIVLYIYDIQTKKIKKIGSRIIGFSLSSDGKKIAISSGRSLNSIKIWDLEKRMTFEVKEESEDTRIIYLNPKFSPKDSDLLAFERQKFSKKYWEEGIFIYNLKTKSVKKITPTYFLYSGKTKYLFSHNSWEWSSDGNSIYYSSRFPSLGMWKVDLEKGERKIITSDIIPYRYYPSPDANLCLLRVEEKNPDFESIYLYIPKTPENICPILQNILGLEGVLWRNKNSIIFLTHPAENLWEIEQINLFTKKRKKIFKSFKKIRLVNLKEDILTIVENEKSIIAVEISTLKKKQIFP